MSRGPGGPRLGSDEVAMATLANTTWQPHTNGRDHRWRCERQFLLKSSGALMISRRLEGNLSELLPQSHVSSTCLDSSVFVDCRRSTPSRTEFS